MVADRKKGRFDPNAQPPSRGYGSSHAKRPITAIGEGPRNALERLAADAQRSARGLEEKVREATERAHASNAVNANVDAELGQHLGHIEFLLNAMIESVDGYATEVRRNTRAVEQNTLELRENTKLLRQALGLDHPEIGPLTAPKPVLSTPAQDGDILLGTKRQGQDDRS